MGTAARSIEALARERVRLAYGETADVRDDQLAAIQTVLDPASRVLLVQTTGWGKSLVYFSATAILRDRGEGPTLIVSPLVSLIRNQVETARRFGLVASGLSGFDHGQTRVAARAIQANELDILIVSAERLASPTFRTRLLERAANAWSLLVIDEAHCVSEWGHDFRPDYRRLRDAVKLLSPECRVLAVTGSANERVTDDLREQFGDLTELRGDMLRRDLNLSVVSLPHAAERLAWLATYVPRLRGSGIIYCLTIQDANRVATWLQQRQIDAAAYHAGLPSEERAALERAFMENRIRALVATEALGMGFDKPDVRYVLHFQRPDSLLAYTQHIGRGGRDGKGCFAVLLEGYEDEKIAESRIQAAYPSFGTLQMALHEIRNGRSPANEQEATRFASQTEMRLAIATLESEGAVQMVNGQYQVNDEWRPSEARATAIRAARRRNLRQLNDYVLTLGCRLQVMARLLGEPIPDRCGKCDRCLGRGQATLNSELLHSALAFLGQDRHLIEPKRSFPKGAHVCSGRIPQAEQHETGIALSAYNDPLWGKLVVEGKYRLHRYGNELIEPSIEAISSLNRNVGWMCWVPNGGHRDAVGDFCRRLGKQMRLPVIQAITRVPGQVKQKLASSSLAQFEVAWSLMDVRPELIRTDTCLLVDDMIDSGWTIATLGIKLRRAGSGPVIPFALTTSAARSVR